MIKKIPNYSWRDKGSNGEQFIRYHNYGDMNVAAITNVERFAPSYLFKFLNYFNVNVHKDASVHYDFNDQKLLIPVIFSHGLRMNRLLYANVCWELASQGCQVYALDHDDDTCSCAYSIKWGHSIYKPLENFPKPKKIEEYWKKVREIRIPEIRELISIIKKDSEVYKNMDFDKLTIVGHSFGGVTALESAKEFPEIKYCIALDPWLFFL